MIFIALGTQNFQMNRLLKKIDDLIEQKKIQEPVFAQVGHSDYIPKYYDFIDFLPQSMFDDKIETCDLLITHSGVGTIISGLTKRKPVIVVPRLSKYGEHVDDHQLQIARSFAEMNYVLLCRENDDLHVCIEKSRRHTFNKYISRRKDIICIINDFLEACKGDIEG